MSETFLGGIFRFIVEKGRILFLIISIAVLLEGMLYLFFPKKIKSVVENCPVSLFRILGILAIIFGIILILLYLEILRKIL